MFCLYPLIADALRRSQTIPIKIQSKSEQEVEAIGLVIVDQSVTSHLKENAEEKAKDSILESVMRHISEGWTVSKRHIPAEILPFWTIKHELSFSDGIIHRGDHIVVPITLRKTDCKAIASTLGNKVNPWRCKNTPLVYWDELSTETVHCHL